MKKIFGDISMEVINEPTIELDKDFDEEMEKEIVDTIERFLESKGVKINALYVGVTVSDRS